MPEKTEQEAVSGDKEWFTVQEAGKYLGISEPTVYRWMRDGKLSFYKVGDSTRFKKENLDMVYRKHTSEHEADYYGSRCVACGHSHLVPGKIQSTGNVYFKPAKTRFFALMESFVGMQARVCPRCGFVQLFTDTRKLNKLLVEKDRVSNNGGKEE
jgi:excisionase family DNA binding protein